MLQFRYKAIDLNSKKVTGVIDEIDIYIAATRLKEKGLTIIDLKEIEVVEKSTDEKKKEPIDILEKISFVGVNSIIAFVDQLASLIESGVPVIQSIGVLESQTSNRKLKKAIKRIKDNIENGKSLSESMEEFPKIFNKMIVSIVKTGEESGLIDEALRQVSKYLEEQAELRRQVITSLLYPGIVLVVTIGVVIFMVTYVVPKLMPFIEMGGGEITGSTKILIDASEYIRENLKVISLSIVALISIMFLLSKTKKGKYSLDRIKMKIPVVGAIFQYSAIIKFSKTLSILIGSGVSIVQALKSTSEVIENEVVKDVILNMSESVLAGENLSTPIMRAGNIFPPIVESVIKVGEQTGNIDNSLATISEMFDKMFQNRIRLINVLLEPLLMLVMGGIVAFVASGLIGGILSSYGQF